MSRRYPKTGTIYFGRDSLITELLEAGWEIESAGHSLGEGEITEADVVVVDKKKNIRLYIYARAVPGGVRVSKMTKTKYYEKIPSDYRVRKRKKRKRG